MINCRSIPPEMWEQARQSLVFFFAQRHARSDAEDLAQKTLLTIWSKEDYEFEREEDFLKVCYGFARHISKEGYRESQRHAAAELETTLTAASHEWGGQRATEGRILLEQVCAIGRTKLRDQEWHLIQQTANGTRAGTAQEPEKEDANRARVRLHRARRKLAKLTGLDKH